MAAAAVITAEEREGQGEKGRHTARERTGDGKGTRKERERKT
jgi:hypothetical protein